MAEKKLFFDIFSDFSPDLALRRHLSRAYVTDMVLESAARTLTLELETREVFPGAACAAIEGERNHGDPQDYEAWRGCPPQALQEGRKV